MFRRHRALSMRFENRSTWKSVFTHAYSFVQSSMCLICFILRLSQLLPSSYRSFSLCLSTQTHWVLYGQASRAISTTLASHITALPHLAYQRRSLRRPFRGLIVPVRSHLGRGFPLRCFQRLSCPNIATRQCHWRDNRNTRGSSTPVLSY